MVSRDSAVDAVVVVAVDDDIVDAVGDFENDTIEVLDETLHNQH
jgi:hypothetical protein